MEADRGRAEIFESLRENELEHARKWADLIGVEAARITPGRVGLASIILWLTAKMIGTVFIARFLIRGHEKNLHEIARLPDPAVIADAAKEQANALRRLAYPDKDHTGDAHHEGGFLSGEGGTLRAAVLGVNDGLVSNFSLVMGVSGGTSDTGIILLAGLAGLLAGAFSMAAGEYVSMRSQKDVYENLVRMERTELELWPEEEEAELAAFYREKGLKDEEAKLVAARIHEDPAVSLDTHLREEFGLDQNDLGSPWGAAFASMGAFAMGAVVPIAPYLFSDSSAMFYISGAMSAVALVFVGAGLAWLSGINWVWGGARMLLVGVAAAAVTYGVGSLIGQRID
jgi:VIT1/CCC1 family predicted Fe2+/Mn2+ transporter